MSLTDRTPRRHEIHVEYRLEIETAEAGSFSFECNEEGVPTFTNWGPPDVRWQSDQPMPPEFEDNPAWLNYLGSLFLWTTTRSEVVKYEHDEVIPATGKCVCGDTVELDYDYGHGIDCKCGRIYNLSGQELAPRSQWTDYFDEDSTQPYFAEFGYQED